MNGGGHRIAWRLCTNHVTSKTLQALQQLNRDPNNVDFKNEVAPDDADFISAATEPDYEKQLERMRNNGCPSMAGDHFTNFPTAPPDQQDLIAGMKEPTGNNAITVIMQSIADLQAYAKALQSGQPVDPAIVDKAAQAKDWMAHQTGDFFGQPLHCINRFSQDFPAPKGDEGGNSINLPNLFPPSVKYQELHAYCDAMGVDVTALGGQYATPFAEEAAGPVTAPVLAKIDAKVATIENQYPSKYFTSQQLTLPDISSPEALSSSLAQIEKENVAAAEKIYNHNNTEMANNTQIATNDPWLTASTDVLHERAALGAYRMAYVLDLIFDPANAAQAAVGTGPLPGANVNLAVDALTNPSVPDDMGATASSSPTAGGFSSQPTPGGFSSHPSSGHRTRRTSNSFATAQ